MIWLPLSDAAAAGMSPSSVAASRQLLLPSQHFWQMLLLSFSELSDAGVAMRSEFPPLALLLAFLWSTWSISMEKNPSVVVVWNSPCRRVGWVSALAAFVRFTNTPNDFTDICNWRVSHVWDQLWFSVGLLVFPLAVPRAHYTGWRSSPLGQPLPSLCHLQLL